MYYLIISVGQEFGVAYLRTLAQGLSRGCSQDISKVAVI